MRKKMKKIMKRLLTIAICCVLISNCVLAFAVGTDTEPDKSSNKTVRVGWYQSAMFQEGFSSDEIKSGYCYDYLQKVADYASWKYEYVYGNWEDLFYKLQTGEIDFLGGVSATDERRKTMLFPEYAMGTDQYYLFKRSGDNNISAGNLSTLNGKTLGAIGNNRMTVLAKEWIDENKLDLKIVYFKDFGEQEDAFKNGEIDLIVQTINNVLNISDIDIISKVGEEPFYLAVSKKSSELLAELNYSLGKMLFINPFVLQNLQYKNYGANLINKTLDDDELEWLNAHETVIVGYLDDYLPYSSTDKNGKVTGLLTDVFSAIIKSLKLENELIPEYRAFKNYGDMIDALKRGEIHTAFPVYGNLWDLEQDGVNASSEVVQTSEAFFYKSSNGVYNRDDVKKIAVNKYNDLQRAYCKRVFPKAEILYCSSIEECLNMVLNGKADGTIVNTLRTEIVTRNSKYNSLSYIQLDVDESRCFGVNEGNAELLTILNRGLRTIGSSYGIDNAYKYMEDFYKYGIADFVRDNIVWIVLAICFVVFIIISLLVVSLKKKEGEVKQKEASIRQATAFNKRIELLKDKADRANAAKTNFLSRMSHDIRTPLNGIIGLLEIDAAHPDNRAQVDQNREKMRVSADHLLSLLNDVLQMSKLESGEVTLAHEPLNLNQLAVEISTIVSQRAAESGVTMVFDKEDDQFELPWVYGSPLHLRQIFLNIFTNCIKYNRVGGSVTSLFQCESMTKDTVTCRWTITDTGIGMSEEYLSHIFDPFTQENTDARSVYQGTGLGMTIVKGLLDRMNGSIEIYSKKETGSTFIVTIPFEIAEEIADGEREENDINCSSIRGLRLLLAEDNELNAEIAEMLLEDEGAVATVVSDGQQAVNLFVEKPAGTFDAILMDVMMPVMDGLMATKAIRALDRADAKTIPIIAMTANAFAEDAEKCLAAGMNSHLTKPLEMDKVKKTINEQVNLSSRNNL